METGPWDCDVAVVGSGFGGSVSALRLAEKGHRVVVLEKGRRQAPGDLLAARTDLRAFLYEPALGLTRGFFWQRVFRDVGIIGGTGVGGGSIVWAGVMLEPDEPFFRDPAWAHLAEDWKAELAPHYETAARMFGRTPCPTHGVMDNYLEATARAMGGETTFGPTPMAIFFGRPGETVSDPFFGGEGPDRTGCILCGGCLVGCPHGAKNSLDRNYLWLAEQQGVEIRPEHHVVGCKPLPGGGYELALLGRPALRARTVVLAGGVLGTLELLFRCRDELGTLPAVSSTLGHVVRTNSEAMTAILAEDPKADLARGPTISSHFHPDERTHITQNRYMGGWHMRFQLGPLVDGDNPRRRALATLASVARHPIRQLRMMGATNFERRLTVLTVMQDHDNRVGFRFARSSVRPWRFVLRSRPAEGPSAPSYLAVANEAARRFADVSGGRPHNLLAESIGAKSVTAHILGGAAMGASSEVGVIDTDHQVFGHPGLYVMDGSAIPANLGVNPSLTITAMAERFAERFPADLDRSAPSSHIDGLPTPPIGASPTQWVRHYRALAAPALDALVGTHEASFVGPRPLRNLSPWAIGHGGLPDWYGKRFVATPDADQLAGINLCRADGGGDNLAEVLRMEARLDASWADGFTTIVVTYPPSSPLPWRRVRDEFRVLDDDTLLGVSFIDLLGARRQGLPFLLRRR